MKRSRLSIAILSVALAVFNAPVVAWAQDVQDVAPATITGHLVGLDGKTAWAGQVVRVVDRATGRLIAQATTDEQGRFSLPELAPGEYLVVVGQVVSRLPVTPERPVREVRLVVSAEQLRGEQIPLADLNKLEEITGTSLLLVGGSVVIIGGAAIGGAVAGYNLPKRTGDGTYVIFVPPVSPSVP